MKTIAPELLPRISTLTGVEERDIKEIIAIRNAGIPTTASDAVNIIKSEYSSEEQKVQARANLTELFRLNIVLASYSQQAREVYQDIYGLICKVNPEIILPAVRKLINFAKETFEITFYASDRKDLPKEIRKEHDKIVRQELLKRAKNLNTALKIWHDFSFTGTSEGDLLVEVTRQLIEEEKSSSTESLGFYFYNGMKTGHPLRMEALIYALECCNDETKLRNTHDVFLRQHKEAQRKSSTSSEDTKTQEVRFLKIAIDEVMKKLDSVCCDSISPDADEKTLLDIRENAVWPTLLPNTLKRSKQLLLEIWEVKRTSPDITFDEALEILS